MVINRKTTRGNVLVVEDSLIMVAQIRTALNDFGLAKIDEVSTGNEAVSLIAAGDYDLIIMDININGLLDGIDVFRKVRSHSHIPVLFISGTCFMELSNLMSRNEDVSFLKKKISKRSACSACCKKAIGA